MVHETEAQFVNTSDPLHTRSVNPCRIRHTILRGLCRSFPIIDLITLCRQNKVAASGLRVGSRRQA
jgi:hypothetical protein